jgi:nucleoside-diphosphate-sugar epimerase
MRVLITGASGFIGTSVLHKLMKDPENHEILSLSREAGSIELVQKKNLECESFDFSNLKLYQNRIKDFQPEVLIHLAWEGIPDFSLEMSLKNLTNSINLFKFVLSLDSCKKVIVSGSCFEYGKKLGECKESDLTRAKDFFTWSKLSLLEFLRLECEKLDKKYAWLRIFYAYGPNQRQESLIPMIINNLEKRLIPDIRKPFNTNDFVYVEDVAEAFNTCTVRDFRSGIYNLGSGSIISVLDVCRTIEKLMFKDSLISNELALKSKESSSDTSFFASTSRSNKELDWIARTDLSQGISKVLNLSK